MDGNKGKTWKGFILMPEITMTIGGYQLGEWTTALVTTLSMLIAAVIGGYMTMLSVRVMLRWMRNSVEEAYYYQQMGESDWDAEEGNIREHYGDDSKEMKHFHKMQKRYGI